MAFDWTKEDGEAARIPQGQDTEVEITKLIFEGKNGVFRSQAGDPRIMIVFTDALGQEAAYMTTLSEKCGWQMRSILGAIGANREKMAADGIELVDFAREDFAKANLMGRKLKIRVKEYVDDAKGNLAEIAALRRPPASASPAPAAKPAPAPAPAAKPTPAAPSVDDIPI